MTSRVADWGKLKKKKLSRNPILVSKISKKNYLKSALRPLNKDLRAIWEFVTTLKFEDLQKHERKPTKMWTSWKKEFQPRKDQKNVISDSHQWPLLDAQIEESFQKKLSTKSYFGSKILKKLNVQKLPQKFTTSS